MFQMAEHWKGGRVFAEPHSLPGSESRLPAEHQGHRPGRGPSQTGAVGVVSPLPSEFFPLR